MILGGPSGNVNHPRASHSSFGAATDKKKKSAGCRALQGASRAAPDSGAYENGWLPRAISLDERIARMYVRQNEAGQNESEAWAALQSS